MRNKAYGVRGVGEDNSDLGRRRRFCGKQRKNGLNFKLKYGLPNLSLKGKAKTRAFHFSFEGKLGPSTFPQRRERGAYFYAYLRIRLKRKRKIRKKVPMSLVLSFPRRKDFAVSWGWSLFYALEITISQGYIGLREKRKKGNSLA